MPLGMEDRRILPGHLRASSSYNYNHGPDRARLNIVNGHGRTGAWVAKYRNTRQWLQIDLRQMSIIKGIATQGRREAHQWVISYILSYSKDGRRFRAYSVGGRLKVLLGFVLRKNSELVLPNTCTGIGAVSILLNNLQKAGVPVDQWLTLPEI